MKTNTRGRYAWPRLRSCAFILFSAAVFSVFAATVVEAAVTLAWDRNPDSVTAGYYVYYGNQSGNYAGYVDVGNATTAVLNVADPAATYYFAVQAYSATGERSQLSAEVVWKPASPPAQPPTLQNPGSTSTTVGAAEVVLRLVASDPAGLTLTYSASGLPPGVSISSSTGVISGIPTTSGVYNVTATVTNTAGLSASQMFTWTILAPPSSPQPPPPPTAPPASPPGTGGGTGVIGGGNGGGTGNSSGGGTGNTSGGGTGSVGGGNGGGTGNTSGGGTGSVGGGTGNTGGGGTGSVGGGTGNASGGGGTGNTSGGGTGFISGGGGGTGNTSGGGNGGGNPHGGGNGGGSNNGGGDRDDNGGGSQNGGGNVFGGGGDGPEPSPMPTIDPSDPSVPPMGSIWSVGDLTPPTLAILSPTADRTYSTQNSKIILTGTAVDNTGVLSVTWSNNRGGAGAALGTIGTTSWTTYPIELKMGQNVLSITATDAAGNTQTIVLIVTRYVDLQNHLN